MKVVTESMTKMEKQALMERIKAMTDEEKLFILRFIPSQYLSHELSRRCDSAASMLNNIDNALRSVNSKSSLEDMQNAIITIKEILN